jgi:N-acylneuraminate cytidylyltransferase
MIVAGAKPLCLIPARGGSKRLPRKNIASLGGRPLLAWTLEAARESGIFDDLWVSSEEDEILRVAEDWGGRPLLRSPGLAEDGITVVQLCLSEIRRLALRGFNYSALYVLLPTSPFRRSEAIHRAWRAFLESGADALLSVVPLEHPPQWALMKIEGWLKPVFPESYELSRQALAQAYRHDGGHAIARIEKFLETKSFLNARTLAFPVAMEEGMDINEPEDLARAEYLLGKRQER